MMRVLLCLGQQHDHRLVALAILVCLVGSMSTVQLFSRIGTTRGTSRAGWVALTSVATGAMVWCTHFVAMLAFRSSAPVVLDPVLTLASLFIAVLLTALGLVVATTGRSRFAAASGGGVIGMAVAAMHYAGMAAYRVDGLIAWDFRYIAGSVLLSVGLAALAFDVLRRDGGLGRRASGAMLLGIAVAALHFTGMAALTIVPLRLHGLAQGLSDGTMSMMAVATAMGGALVIGCAAVSALIDDHTQSETFRRMTHMALHDSLTGLPNRMHFHQLFADKLAEPSANHPHLAVVMLDLARFKQVNDVYGHQAGDQLLVALAEQLSGSLAPGETIARLGGDEFVALKPYDDRDELDAFLARITAVLDKPFQFERFTTTCTASIGIALAPDDGADADTLLAKADLAMYRCKAERSSAPCFYVLAMDEAARRRRELGNQLRAALETDQFHLAYQVQTSLEHGGIVGYEALARWTHPIEGSISPAVFIPLTEELGEISRLGNWVLRTACNEAASWPLPHPIAVNLSPLQLADPLLVDKVRAALIDSGLTPDRLELELTESAIVKDREHALRKLRQIKELGVKVALDDFGTGYSSLDVLRSFPFDRLKLDASFVAEIERDRQAVAILRSVAELGRTLGIPVLAEGIETLAQFAIVRREGCIDVQGYLLGRPDRTPGLPAIPTLPGGESERLDLAA